jgi:ribonuclease R
MKNERRAAKPQAGTTIEGNYSGHPRGFGFLRPIAHAAGRKSLRAHDLFVPPGEAGAAIDGDRVIARAASDGTVRVEEVLERGRKKIAGTFLQGGSVRPDAPSIPRPLPIAGRASGGRGRNPRPGDKVIVIAERDRFLLGEVLGRAGDAEVEDRAILEEAEVLREFPPKAVEEARRFEDGRVGARERRGRVDLRDELTIVTIDPFTARDYDDAISLRRGKDGGFVLGVHIADVSAYVEPGSALDREAEARGSSAYLPASVVPMLPPALCDGLCSLREGEDRLAISILLDLERRGTLQGARAARTVIRSRRRLTYERASRVMEGAGGERRDVAALLRDMRDIARVLRARRPSLEIHEPGVEFVYSPKGDIVDVRTTERDDAHWVIEEFMLSANREVAGWLLRLREPALFRHHPPPGSLKELRDLLAGLGVAGARDRPLPEILRRAEEAGLGAAATAFLMDVLEAAEYNPREPRHDALGFSHYAHFTSPIRRYADLTIHRAVARHLRPGKWVEMLPRGGAAPEPSMPPASTPELERIAGHINLRERAIAGAERRLRRRRVLEFLARRSGEAQPGVVIRVIEDGLLVNLPGFLVSGTIALGALGPGAWKTGDHAVSAGGRIYRPGTEVLVRPKRIDPIRGELELGMA